MPNRSDLLRAFAPTAAAVLAFLLVFGLVGGWILAGRMLAPLTRITDATRMAATGSLSHRIRLEGRKDEFRELADAFDAMLARLEAHVAEQQRFAANASHELRTPLAVTQTLLDVARNDPNRDNGELVERLHAVNTRAIDLTEALLLLSRADQRSFAREHVDLSLIAEEATETLLPLAEERGLTIETSGDVTPTIGSHALLLQMTTNLVHNAIVHNLPEQGTVWVTTSVHPKSVVLTVENTGEKLTPQLVSTLGEPFHRGPETHTHRPRRCRPRPGNRQEHHPSTRRNPHPHPPGRWRALRHGATTRRATAHWQMTIRGIAARPRGIVKGGFLGVPASATLLTRTDLLRLGLSRRALPPSGLPPRLIIRRYLVESRRAHCDLPVLPSATRHFSGVELASGPVPARPTGEVALIGPEARVARERLPWPRGPGRKSHLGIRDAPVYPRPPVSPSWFKLTSDPVGSR